MSFAKVPVPEIGDLANRLQAAGFEFRENVSESKWEAWFAKDVPEHAPDNGLTAEVREIMGDYFAEPARKPAQAESDS